MRPNTNKEEDTQSGTLFFARRAGGPRTIHWLRIRAVGKNERIDIKRLALLRFRDYNIIATGKSWIAIQFEK